ncbi:MAG: hypothetical protein SGPRY_014973 [Prymnesium sp.]
MSDFLAHLAHAASARQAQEKHARRKERNRQSAAVSRKRQQDARQMLEAENGRLQEENAKLRRLLREIAPEVDLPCPSETAGPHNEAANDSDSSIATAGIHSIEEGDRRGDRADLARILLPSHANGQPHPEPAKLTDHAVLSSRLVTCRSI